MTCFPGWTWEYIDQNMTLPRLKAITAYQKDNPPIHILMAVKMGIGRQESKPEPNGLDENGQSLFDLYPQG